MHFGMQASGSGRGVLLGRGVAAHRGQVPPKPYRPLQAHASRGVHPSLTAYSLMLCELSHHGWAPVILMPCSWVSCKPCHSGLLCAKCLGVPLEADSARCRTRCGGTMARSRSCSCTTAARSSRTARTAWSSSTGPPWQGAPPH